MTGKRRRRGRGDDVPTSRPQQPRPVVVGTAGGLGSRSSRRERKREERRRRRRRFGLVALVALAAAVAAVVAVLTVGGGNGSSTSKLPLRTQTTAVVALTGSGGNAVQIAFLAHDTKTRQGVELLIPPRLITDVCGYGTQQVGHIFGLPRGEALARSALSNILGGVRVDGSWVMSTAAFAKVIDALHGVTVDVDTDVVRRGAGGARVLVVAKGPGQRLTGAQAVAFATYVGSGEDASAALDRFHAVLDALMLELPRDPAAAGGAIAAGGASSVAVLDRARLAGLLAGLAGDIRANQVLPSDLPVIAVDAGGGPPAYRIDTEKTDQLVDTNLSASLPGGKRRGAIRVFVQNGVGRPGLVESACARLVAGGFAFAGSGNATSFDFARSKVLVFDNSVASARVGGRVAATLRLPAGDVAVSSQGQNVADVLVILGRDYKP